MKSPGTASVEYQSADHAPRRDDAAAATHGAPPPLPDRGDHQQCGDEQQQRVHRLAATAQTEALGIAEETRAGEQPAGSPVAEDHRGQADVAAATGLAVAVVARRHQGKESAAEPGQGLRTTSTAMNL